MFLLIDLFKELIPSILQTKKKLEIVDGDYVPFVVNKAVGAHYDCVLQVNQMNLYPDLPFESQYEYLINTTRGWKRPFQPWLKNENDESLATIMEYYGISREKAKDLSGVLTNEQILQLKERMQTGGITPKNGRKNSTK